MQSELLAHPRRSEEPTRTRRPPRPELDKGGHPERSDGAQQFLVEWEVPESP